MDRWFRCPSCENIVTSLVREGHPGHPHPEKHFYSDSHCCHDCEQGLETHGKLWQCAGVPGASFRSVKVKSGEAQHYLIHDPGGDLLPVVLFLHGALTFLYPETLWWDVRDLVNKNQTCRDNFIVIAPFCSIGEPIVHPADRTEQDRFYNEVQYVKCFDPDITWDFFVAALRALQEEGDQRFDPERLHVTGYSMGGQAAWSLACLYGSRLASAAPMAARCAWENFNDAWEQETDILAELAGLPIWAYAGKFDYAVVCWGDFGWLADQRHKEAEATETTVATKSGITATIHSWNRDLSLALLENTPTKHRCWEAVLHSEETFQLFTKMLGTRCSARPPKRAKLL
eukprot:Skav232973  [mRNA]  locus=scaffold1735:339193:340221:+ [translate_table: standard]